MWKLLHLKIFPENMISLQVFRRLKNNHGQKNASAKIHAQTATCRYAAQRGDKKRDDGYDHHNPVCRFFLTDAKVAVTNSR